MPWNWRKWFEYMGVTEECEEEQPGHTRGLILFYAALIASGLYALYQVCWKIQ